MLHIVTFGTNHSSYIVSLTLLMHKLCHIPDTRFYFACCRDGISREKTAATTTNKRAKRQSRKLNAVCISRMYVTRYSSGNVRVKYVSSHTNHDLSLAQVKFLPLPKDVKDGITIKLNIGIPIDRILDGT